MKWGGAHSHSFAWRRANDQPPHEEVVLVLLDTRGRYYDQPPLAIADYHNSCTNTCHHATECRKDNKGTLCQGGFSCAFQGGDLPVLAWCYIPFPHSRVVSPGILKEVNESQYGDA